MSIGTPLFYPSPDLQLVEVDFVPAVTTDKIFVGGSAGSQAWNRNWKGGITELIFFTSESTEKERECVQYLLKHKHRLDIDADYYFYYGKRALGHGREDGLFVHLRNFCEVNDDTFYHASLVGCSRSVSVEKSRCA